MANIKYCPLCERNVPATKKFNWPIFLLFCITMIGGIFYIIWYIIRPNNRCPICGSNGLMTQGTMAEMKQADKRMKNGGN